MKYGYKTNKKTETAVFRLDGVEKIVRKSYDVVVLYMRDLAGNKVKMSNFESYWNASLEDGLDFDSLDAGALVDVIFTMDDKYLNFIRVTKHCEETDRCGTFKEALDEFKYVLGDND